MSLGLLFYSVSAGEVCSAVSAAVVPSLVAKPQTSLKADAALSGFGEGMRGGLGCLQTAETSRECVYNRIQLKSGFAI